LARGKKRGTVRRSTCDALFSKLIRERDDYTCQICGENFRDNPGFLDCSHHIGRARGSTRFYPDNASSKCRDCHNDLDRRPLDHYEWVRDTLGYTRWESLRGLGRLKTRRTGKDFAEMAKTMRAQIKSLESRREAGEKGVLCLESP